MSVQAAWGLYRKELTEHRTTLLIIAASIVACELYLATRTGEWQIRLGLAFAAGVLTFLPVLALWQGYQSLRDEFKSHTAYLLLSLPAPAWSKTAIKIAAIMTGVTLIALLTAVASFALAWPHAAAALEQADVSGLSLSIIAANLAKAAVFYWIALLFTVVLGQFAYIGSRLVRRFNGLVGAGTLLLTLIIFEQVTEWLEPLNRYLPSIPFGFGEVKFAAPDVPPHPEVFYATSGALIWPILFGLAIFALGSWLLERRVEV